MDPVIIKRDRIRMEGARDLCTKNARLLEEKGAVVAVELRCSCGEVTVIRIDHQTTTESKETNS